MAHLIRSRNVLKSGLLQKCLRLSQAPLYRTNNRDYASQSSSSSKVRIGCASGFWGDSAVAAPQLINNGKLDYLVFDYLSEITMSLLTAARAKSPEMGYAPDFVQAAMAPFLTSIKKKGIRVISNAGGINPQSCAAALLEVAKKSGVDLKIAVVTGDDLMPQKDVLKKNGTVDMFNQGPFPKGVNSMTAYLGAGPIKIALDNGADVVITGRCTDSALVLGPLVHSFGWSWDNYDLLASGSLAGHLIECGAQVTGGNFTDWRTVPDCNSTFSYLYPSGKRDRVSVSGAVGRPPTPDYKVCATYMDGYRLTAVFSIGGPYAGEKGRKTAEAVIKRVKGIHRMLKMDEFRKVHVQVIGAEDTYGKNAAGGPGPREAVVYMSFHHDDKRALQLLAREIAPAGTGMAPGLCGIVGGRPKVSPILKLFSFLYPKSSAKINIDTNLTSLEYQAPEVVDSSSSSSSDSSSDSDAEADSVQSGAFSYRLEELAYTRSGDKGNNCNIGVIARHPSYVPYLRAALTPEAVDTYMSHVFDDRSGTVADRVTRYEMPGINGFNFVLHNSLGGGGVASLRNDPQGKAFGQMLLDFNIENIPNIVEAATKSG